MTLLDDMLALLPDNTAGDISAADMRSIVTDLYNNAQPVDSDLTTIAGLTATTDSIMQSKSSAWSARTLVQVAADLQSLLTISESQVTNLVSDLAAKQPLDSDLTTIAGLTATTDNVIQSVASTWASRTPAQLKSTLALVKGDVGLGNVDNTSDANKPVSTATQTALDLKQNLDSDLTAIAALTPTNDDIIQRKAGAWTNRTMAQLGADVQGSVTIAESQVTNLVSDLAGKTDKSTLTTKGDLYVATGSATPVRIGVGSNGQVLTADSGETPGVKWATPSGGSSKPQIARFPLHNQAPTSNPAGLGWINNRPVLTFADTPSQVAIFTALLPASYAAGGLQVRVGWAAAATSGTVGWLIAIERIGTTLDTDTDSFASDQTITAATVSGTSGVLTVTSVTISDGANMDSLAAGELFRIRVTRDTANDNAAGLAYLHFVEILEP